jgi:biotin carboxyl carrier protein
MNTKWLYNDEEIEAVTPAAASAHQLPDGDITLVHNGRTVTIPCARDAQGRVWLAWQGRSFAFTPIVAGKKRAAAKKSGCLSAPMTGVVAEVLVSVGQHVDAYQPLVTLEAMKVLATLEAPFAGTVTAVHVQKKDRVEHGMVLIEVEPCVSLP